VRDLNFKADNGGVDKLAIAEQVIVSAGNILAAAGFRREEIGSFFRQAAEQLEPGVDGRVAQRATVATRRLDSLRLEFLTIPPVRELEILQSRAQQLADESRPASELFALAMEAVPHIGAAQDWLRSMAEEMRLPIAIGRPASTDDPTGEQIVFEDFEAPYRPSFLLIGEAFRLLGQIGEDEAFRTLLIALVEHNVTITAELKDTIETWINVAN